MTDPPVERVPAGVTFPLRQRVLRPHQSLDMLALPDDDDPETATFAVRDPKTGEVLTTANVRPQAPPDTLFEELGPLEAPWRLRGMATREDLRGRGLGRLVLDACVEHVGALGGGLLWCNARLGARRFYARAGFAERGEEFEEPGIGPHVVMFRHVPAGGGQAEPAADTSLDKEAS